MQFLANGLIDLNIVFKPVSFHIYICDFFAQQS